MTLSIAGSERAAISSAVGGPERVLLIRSEVRPVFNGRSARHFRIVHRAVDLGETEAVKWAGPSFEYRETLATFSPRVKDCVALVFHDGEPFMERFPFLEAGQKGKAR